MCPSGTTGTTGPAWPWATAVIMELLPWLLGLCFPDGSAGKEFTCNAGDMGDAGLIPGSRGYLEEENGNPVQYSCLKNPMDRGAWHAKVRGVTESWKWLSDWCMQAISQDSGLCPCLILHAFLLLSVHPGTPTLPWKLSPGTVVLLAPDHFPCCPLHPYWVSLFVDCLGYCSVFHSLHSDNTFFCLDDL